MKYNISYVMDKKFPNCKTSIVGGTYEGMHHESGDPLPSLDEVIAADLELQKEEYLINIKAEIPSHSDCFYMIYQSMEEGILPKDNNFYPMMNALSQKHPKSN